MTSNCHGGWPQHRPCRQKAASPVNIASQETFYSFMEAALRAEQPVEVLRANIQQEIKDGHDQQKAFKSKAQSRFGQRRAAMSIWHDAITEKKRGEGGEGMKNFAAMFYQKRKQL